jgi:hypothetical protein
VRVHEKADAERGADDAALGLYYEFDLDNVIKEFERRAHKTNWEPSWDMMFMLWSEVVCDEGFLLKQLLIFVNKFKQPDFVPLHLKLFGDSLCGLIELGLTRSRPCMPQCNNTTRRFENMICSI